MKKKRLYNRIGCVVIALIMILSLGLSPTASNVARAEDEDVSSGLSIVSTDNNLTYLVGETIDVAEYFTINYNGAEPYCIGNPDTYEYYLETAYDTYKAFYEMFDVRYVEVVEGEEKELTEIPSAVGTYKAYASLPGTEYEVCPTYDDWGGTWPVIGGEELENVEEGVIEFEIAETIKGDYDTEDIGELKLVYGSEDLADEDAFILLMFGDGFTAEQQEDFYQSASENAEYIMNTSPWSEFTDVVKIYALGTVSNESGATGENAKTLAEVEEDTRDTFFKSSFWSYGLQRLLAVDSYGQKQMKALKADKLPSADYSVLIVNSATYGGSGGEFCVASLNTSSLEMMLHELGHTVADLADEYWAAPGSESANMTQTSDPEEVRWSRFIGKNGIGVYEYDNGGDGWYRPSQNCKMRFLGSQYAFCEVCKEELRKAFCKDSNVTKLFFQPYADTFYEGECKDMKEYFILRKGEEEVTGDELGDALTLTYVDKDGKTLNSFPDERGTYTIKATFAGNETFDPCTLETTYTVELPNLMDLQIESKVYDGEPAEYKCEVDYDDEYYTEAHYTGSVTYSSSSIASYDSDEAPTKPGDYEITVTAYDEETKEPISRQTKSYSITFKQTAIVDNNSLDYPGASVEYNNQTIVITGEGFTADEQDKFEELAQKYVDYIQNTEPFKEMQLYFNFTTVEAESNQSGIGTEAGDTYFKLYYDETGKIVPNSAGDEAATYLGYNIVTAYYKSTIVIVNDENVKEGASTGRAIYAGTDEDSMAYAARELLNYLTNHSAGYVAETEEEIAAQRSELLVNLGLYWYYEDYAIILSRAYDEKFVESGSPVELDDYFHTYLSGVEVPNSELNYDITYYDSEGNKLDGAPSKAGTYRACAELNPPEDGYYMETYDETVRKLTETERIVAYGGYDYVYDDAIGDYTGWALYFPATEVVLDGESHLIPRARGWTTFTIQAGGTGSGGGSGITSDPVEDPTNDVTVTVTVPTLPDEIADQVEEVVLNVTPLDQDEEKKAESVLADNSVEAEDIKILDISVSVQDSNGDPVELDEGTEMTVTLTVPDGWDAERTAVYHVDTETNEVTDMNAEASDDGTTISFNTTHFSYYAMVQLEDSKETEDPEDNEQKDPEDNEQENPKDNEQENPKDNNQQNVNDASNASGDQKNVKTEEGVSAVATGDNNHMILWSVLLIMAIVGICVGIFRKKRMK